MHTHLFASKARKESQFVLVKTEVGLVHFQSAQVKNSTNPKFQICEMEIACVKLGLINLCAAFKVCGRLLRVVKVSTPKNRAI